MMSMCAAGSSRRPCILYNLNGYMMTSARCCACDAGLSTEDRQRGIFLRRRSANPRLLK
ncbi:MAG: hypothetical protein ACLR4Z_05490 [Butyricicoccaceae bacterium]